MAAELFSNFADLKTYVGGRLNQSVKLESLEATIYETARRHIVPWLGSTLYTSLNGGSLSAELTALLPYVKRPLALLTIYEYSKVGAIEVGESGMHRVETDTRKSAYRYQEREYKEDALIKGYNALEQMLKYLDDHQSDFSTWASSAEGRTHLTPLLNYASDFRLLTLPDCDRYTFECLRPIISEIQLLGIQRLLPKSFWDGLLSRHLAGTLTDAEKQLRTYMRQAIAHKAITEAVKQRWVKVDGGRVSIQEDFGDQRNTNQTMPSSTGSGLYLSHDTWSDRFTSTWMDYIGNNPDDFEGVFDEDSGGTNTDSDAWHINNDDEQAIDDAALVETNNRPIFRL